MHHLAGIGGIAVEATRRVNRGVECLGQDEEEVEVMFVRVHGLG